MYYFVGSCISSFDEDAECSIPGLPYRDVSEFAQAEEYYKRVSKRRFTNNVNMSQKFEKLINSKMTELLYDKDNNIFIMYDGKKDIHYFFV